MKISLRKNWGFYTINTIISTVIIYFITGLFLFHPASKLVKVTGEAAIWMLVLTLACTPVAALFKIKRYRRFRKSFGIFTFLFSVTHVIAFAADRQWDPIQFFMPLFAEFNLVIGGVAFLLLCLLGLTSNKASIRKLRKYWKKLHGSTYLIAILCVIHVVLIKDQFQSHNMYYAFIFGALLILRLPIVKGLLIQFKPAYEPAFKIKKPSHRIKGTMAFGFLVMGSTIALSGALQGTSQVDAKEKYRYDRDSGFFSFLFMTSKMPTVNHKNTQRYCNDGCHWTIQPGLLPQKTWEMQMNNLGDHYGESVHLDPEVKQDITRYLTQNAAEYTEAKLSVRILKSLAGNVPSGVSDIPYIVHEHDDIKPSVYQRKSVRGLSNCPACHLDVEKTGDYNDRHVEVPDF